MMKNKYFKKGMALALILTALLTLTGCQVDPAVNQNNPGGGTFTFQPYSPPTSAPTKEPTSNPFAVPTAVIPDINNPVNNGIQFPSVVTNTPDAGGWVSIIGLPTTAAPVNVPGVITPPPTSTPTSTPITVFKKGVSGAQVKTIQQKLKDLGFYKGSVDGNFGEATETAVKRFQSQYGLTPDGIVGETTLTKLSGARATARPSASPSPTPSNVLKKGDTGTAVKQVQQRLKDLGFYKGSVDGSFGDGTVDAVKRFQSQYGLTPDGIVGATTKTKLANARATARPAATKTPKATATPVFKSDTILVKGDNGSQVRQMQQRLISLGYLLGSATGEFDTCTELAVTAFQNRNCSYSDGKAGQLTLSALYSSSAKSTSTAVGIIGVSLSKGSTGAAVQLLQKRLKALGYYSGSVDGTYGDSTVNAVKNFQRVNGLNQDGKAGGGTFNKLFPSSAKPYSASSVTATPKKVTKKPTVTPYKTATPLPPNVYVKVTMAPNNGYFTLRRGYYGTPVEKMQQELKKQGYITGNIDGIYGEGTEEAVKSFQRVNGLHVDGVAGPATLRVLYEGNFPSGS